MSNSTDIVAIVIGLLCGLFWDAPLLPTIAVMQIKDAVLACLSYHTGIVNYLAAKCVANNPVGYHDTMLAYLSDVYRPP